MRVAIHQPHYWPWLGYLCKIKKVDIFVYLDKVMYIRHGFQNRNKILIDSEEHWLTIPILTKGKYANQPIMDVKINGTIQWQKKHYRTLLHNYKKMDKNKKETLDKFFNFDSDKLVDWNARSIDLLCDAFDIETKRIFESELNIKEPYAVSAKTKSEICTGRIIKICKELGADIYLCGAVQKDYIDERLFDGIDFEYMNWMPESTLSALHFYLENDTGALKNKIKGES